MAKPEAKRATRIRAGRLLGAVKDVIGTVVAKDTIPILRHVMIDAGNGLIRLTATDLDMEARRTCASDDRDGPDSADWRGTILPFATTVPGKALLAILAQFDADAMVTLTVDDVSDRLVIAAGRSRFRLATLPVADFPTLAAGSVDHDFDIGAGVLADAIDSVEHAISTEETRYYLNGVYLHPQGLNLHLATTDGHRLARLRIDAPDGAHAWPPMIVPRRAVAELGKALAHAMKVEGNPQVRVTTNEPGRMIAFDMPAADDGAMVLITKVIDGTFPDYMKVIPAAPPMDVGVVRQTLADAVARVAALAHKDSQLIRFDITADRIDLTVTNADLGDAREEVPARYDGADLAVGFNAKYLCEILDKIATDDVVLRLTDAQAPVRIEASGDGAKDDDGLPRLVHVLMPVRV